MQRRRYVAFPFKRLTTLDNTIMAQELYDANRQLLATSPR